MVLITWILNESEAIRILSLKVEPLKRPKGAQAYSPGCKPGVENGFPSYFHTRYMPYKPELITKSVIGPRDLSPLSTRWA